MADNYHIRDASGTRRIIRTTDAGGEVHTPHFIPTPLIPGTTNVNSAATTNALLIKSTAGTVFSLTATNINAAVRFLKLYNMTTTPVVGTSVPILTLAIPPGGVLDLDFGALGRRFTSGIGMAITALGPDADATVVTVGDTKVSIAFT